MIFFDVTKTGGAGHRSGLTRVSGRLLEELGPAAKAVRWPQAAECGVTGGDWYVTAELFSAEERPGFVEWMERRPCRFGAIFHDAIPLRHPKITWPQSVARHPGYMKLLARFDRVWAVSEASRRELVEFWRWQGVENPPPVAVLGLGADFNGIARRREPRSGARSILCIGIVEPRKNQSFLAEVCADLWREGLEFDLHVVGRVNPHFGAPIVARMEALRREFRGLHFHEAATDEGVTRLYAESRATVLPTLAEGCGLPLLESLWMGVPCLCSDLPVLRENADGGGCVPLPLNDRVAWATALRRALQDDEWLSHLAGIAVTRALPTWRDAAQRLSSQLG